jgi:hypothetical protein
MCSAFFIQYFLVILVVITVVRHFFSVRPIELHLCKCSLQNFHEAVSVGVVMDGRPVTLSPAEDYQVKFPVSLIYQVSSVPNRKTRLMRKKA